jgi:hypothetical protein
LFDSEGDETRRKNAHDRPSRWPAVACVRRDGTKTKFYLFARRTGGGLAIYGPPAREIKQAVRSSLDELWIWAQADVKVRLQN